MPGLIGYDPNRTPELRRRAQSAAEHLLRLPPFDDPLGADASSVARLVRAHLEHDWLPALDRVVGSTAMLGFSGAGVHGVARPARDGDGSGPPASNSLDSELNPAAQDAPPEPPAPITEVVLPNGWSYGCGPVSASTGQPASGCEWMPPTVWDMEVPLLVASFLPFSGEVLDAYDCVTDKDVPCELIVVPFVSARGANALDEVLTSARRAVDARRGFEFTSAESWFNSKKLQRHFRDHGADFGATSAEDYAQRASDFFDRAVMESLPTKIDPRDGTIRLYDPATNTFGSYNPDGETLTFYKPDPAIHGKATNMDYWNGLPG